MEFINKALITSERPVCVVYKGEEIDQAALDLAVTSFREIFNQDVPEANEASILFDSIQIYLKKYTDEFLAFEDEYFRNYPFGQVFHDIMKVLNKWLALRDPKALFEVLHLEKNETKKLFDKAKGMADFASRFRKDYDAIKLFMEANRDNFSALSPADQQKVEMVLDTLNLDDPRSDFRHVVKAWDELKKSLKSLISDMKSEILGIYELIFSELDAELLRLNIHEPNIIADKSAFMNKINTSKSVPQIINLQLDASNFKSNQIANILRYAALKNEKSTGNRVGEPQEMYLSKITSTISNRDEMELYISKVRSAMIELLDQNKIIIIK